MITDDASIVDWGRTCTGREAIARWNDGENTGVQRHIEATGVKRDGLDGDDRRHGHRQRLQRQRVVHVRGSTATGSGDWSSRVTRRGRTTATPLVPRPGFRVNPGNSPWSSPSECRWSRHSPLPPPGPLTSASSTSLGHGYLHLTAPRAARGSPPDTHPGQAADAVGGPARRGQRGSGSSIDADGRADHRVHRRGGRRRAGRRPMGRGDPARHSHSMALAGCRRRRRFAAPSVLLGHSTSSPRRSRPPRHQVATGAPRHGDPRQRLADGIALGTAASTMASPALIAIGIAAERTPSTSRWPGARRGAAWRYRADGCEDAGVAQRSSSAWRGAWHRRRRSSPAPPTRHTHVRDHRDRHEPGVESASMERSSSSTALTSRWDESPAARPARS